MKSAVVRWGARWRPRRSGGALATLGACGALLLGGCATLAAARQGDAPQVSTSQQELSPRSHAIYDVLAGELADRAGDPKQALAYYLKALHEAPEPELARRVIDIAIYLGDNDTALEAARRWVGMEATSADAQRTLGVIEARAGHPLLAAEHLRRFVRLSGKPYDKSLVLCGALLSQGVDRAVALQAMRSLTSDFPREAYAQYALGTLALHLVDTAQALDSADRALKLKPNFKEALILKAQAQMGMGRSHLALRTLRDALAKDRSDVGLQLAYARLLVQAKRYAGAREQFRALLKNHPDNAGVLYTLGLLDYQLGRDAEARSYLQRLLHTGQHSAAAEYFLGRIAERAGKVDAAMRHYANVDSDPYQFDARVRVAYILAEQGELDQARQYLAQLRAEVSAAGRKITLYLAEAGLLEQAADDAQAMNLYNEALSHYPHDTRLLYARALLADKLGDLGRAEADLKDIVQHHPDNAMALNALGYTLADRTTRYREALGYIQRALALRPDDPEILDSMGWVQYRLKHYDMALRYLRRAYAKTQDPEIAAHLAEALFVSGERAEAVKTLDAALKAHPGNTKLEQLKRRLAP